MNPRTTVADMKQFVSGRLNNQAELEEFCMSLILGVRRNQTELDEQLSKIADNWSVARMAATDRNVIRLGCLRNSLHRYARPRRRQRSRRARQTLRQRPIRPIRKRHPRQIHPPTSNVSGASSRV